MQVRGVMTTHPSVVTPDDLISRAARILRDRNIGILPVIDNLRDRSLMGVLTDRDIVVRCVAEGHQGGCRVRDHMTRGSVTVAELDADAAEVAAKMEGFQLRRLPVLDEFGKLIGIVSLSDLVRRVPRGERGPLEQPEPFAPRVLAFAH